MTEQTALAVEAQETPAQEYRRWEEQYFAHAFGTPKEREAIDNMNRIIADGLKAKDVLPIRITKMKGVKRCPR